MTTEPALAGTIAAHRLTGMSGADVYLTTADGDHWFVRKIAGTASMSDRLRHQASKHGVTATWSSPLRVPAVLRDGECDGRYWFDMEHIIGVDGATHLRRAPIRDVARFADQLAEHVHALSTTSAGSALDIGEAVAARVDTALASASLPPLVATRARELLRVLEGVLVMPGPCHGDLTLENMIVDREGTIWAVDVSDPPFEHWWQDVAKLHQDLTGEWYRRRSAPISPTILDHVSRRVFHAASIVDKRYPAVHDALLLVTFLRILPYALTEEARDFVVSRIGRLTIEEHV